MSNSKYRQLMWLLAGSSVDYRVINHRAEGHTERASELRGHALSSAAKCMVVSVKEGGTDSYVVAVLPGDRLVDYRKLKAVSGGEDVRLADRVIAEKLTGCKSGCIVPFSFGRDLSLIFDSALLAPNEVYFNAACLDRSIGLHPRDLVTLSQPYIADISK